MNFGEKIRNLRLDSKLTQEQASNKMGIAISSLRNYENGRIPDTHQLKIIKNFYNVSYEYLLEDNCENKTDKNISIYKEISLTDSTIEKLKDINKNVDNSVVNILLNSLNIDFWNEFDEYIFVNKLNNKYSENLENFLDNCETFFDILDDSNKLDTFLCSIDEIIPLINEIEEKSFSSNHLFTLLTYYDCQEATNYLENFQMNCKYYSFKEKDDIEETFQYLGSFAQYISGILKKIYLVLDILKLNLSNSFNTTLSKMKRNIRNTSVPSQLYDKFELYLKELEKR